MVGSFRVSTTEGERNQGDESIGQWGVILWWTTGSEAQALEETLLLSSCSHEGLVGNTIYIYMYLLYAHVHV